MNIVASVFLYHRHGLMGIAVVSDGLRLRTVPIAMDWSRNDIAGVILLLPLEDPSRAVSGDTAYPQLFLWEAGGQGG